MRITWKRTIGLGAVAAAVFAAWRASKARLTEPTGESAWEPAPFPFPPAPRPVTPIHLPHTLQASGGPETEEGASDLDMAPVMEPLNGMCPASHPVKGKRGSGIYHVPGGANYDRTRPDRCYVDAAAAEADGLRPAKN